LARVTRPHLPLKFYRLSPRRPLAKTTSITVTAKIKKTIKHPAPAATTM